MDKILESIKSGAGFVNPLSAPIQSAMSVVNIPPLAQFHTMAQAQYAALNLPAPQTSVLNDAHNKMVEAYNSTQDLLGHTDKISGVNLRGNGTIAQIAKTMQSAKTINGDLACSGVLGAFGSLMKAAEMIQKVVGIANNITNFIKNIPKEIKKFVAKIEALTNEIKNQILQDVNALLEAQLAVLQNAVGNALTDLFNDPCFGQVLSGVMSDKLKGAVTEKIDDLKSKRIKF